MLDLYQLELESGLDLVEEDSGYISISVLMLDKSNGIVKVSSSVEYQGAHFKVTELAENRIQTVMISFK